MVLVVVVVVVALVVAAVVAVVVVVVVAGRDGGAAAAATFRVERYGTYSWTVEDVPKPLQCLRKVFFSVLPRSLFFFFHVFD